MAKIVELKISNFRGIKEFNQKFDKDFICFIGRGDSGKSTILEAISSVLSPAWNLTFHDTDFYNCNIDKSIEIEASLIDMPAKLLTENKYGLYIRGFNSETNEIEDELKDTHKKVLTIKLLIDRNLEPQWVVTNNREQEDRPISASDRAQLNCFIVSDYIDRHFSWNKGNPLYSLLKLQEQPSEENKNIVIDALRSAKSNIDTNGFSSLSETITHISNKAAAFGLDISNTQTTIDFKDLSIKDGRMCLHDQNIPFRLKGKGSKRLASIAIQSALAQEGGIMLIDEIEQGLEPDRIKQLTRTLKSDNPGQIFITTHSREAIIELDAKDLLIIHHDKQQSKIVPQSLNYNREKLKGTVRACPEAFFAKKIIVCEGATEVGICRALDKYRKQNGKDLISFKDCAYTDGGGDEFPARAEEIKNAGFEVAIFSDSDKDSTLSPSKEELRNKHIKIFDCASPNSIEKQVFIDLPWAGVLELIDYVMKVYNKTEDSLKSSIKEKYTSPSFPSNWRNTDTPEMRTAIYGSAVVKKKEWFKRIDHGEAFGNVIFKYIDEMDDDNHLKKMLTGLSSWIDE